jgi:hypothetical protein
MIFFAARDLSLTEELALLAPQVMLPLLQNPTVVNVSVAHWLDLVFNMVISPLGRLRLQIATPRRLCPVAAPFDSEKIVEQPPLLRDLSLKSTERKSQSQKIR